MVILGIDRSRVSRDGQLESPAQPQYVCMEFGVSVLYSPGIDRSRASRDGLLESLECCFTLCESTPPPTETASRAGSSRVDTTTLVSCSSSGCRGKKRRLAPERRR